MILDKDILYDYLENYFDDYNNGRYFFSVIEDYFNCSCDDIIDAFINMVETFADKQLYILCASDKDHFYIMKSSYGTDFSLTDTLYIYNPFTEKFELCYKNHIFTTPNWFTYVQGYAFYSNDKIQEIYFSDNIKRIDDNVCCHCTDLKIVHLPKNLEVIPAEAFYSCIKLQKINLPNSLRSIRENSFSDCRSLPNIDLPQSLKDIGPGTFHNCFELTSIRIPNNVKHLEDSLFRSCFNLEKIKLPKNLETIGDGVFWDCDTIKTIELPFAVRYIGEHVFDFCYNLTVYTNKNNNYVIDYCKENNIKYKEI